MSDNFSIQVTCYSCEGSKTVALRDAQGEIIGTRDCNGCSGTGKKQIYWIERHNVNVLESYQILEATNEAEYDALSVGNTLMYNALISCGLVDMNDGKKGKTWLWTLFDSESTTRAALTALLS